MYQVEQLKVIYLLLGPNQASSVSYRHLLWLTLAASLINFRIHRARIVPVCLYQAMSTTHFGRLRSFIGIYCARYVKWGTPDRDGILVLAQQIKQIKIQIFPQDVSHALTSQWPPSGSCDRFRDLFLYCPPTHPSPRFDRFTDLFLFESYGQTYLNAAPHAAGFCPVYFLRTVIICNNRVFAREL